MYIIWLAKSIGTDLFTAIIPSAHSPVLMPPPLSEVKFSKISDHDNSWIFDFARKIQKTNAAL